MVKILVLHPKGYERDTFFPRHIKKQLDEIGEVHWNESNQPYTEDTLFEVISDKDICLAGWSVPVFTKRILDRAEKLKYIGQIGGSVKHYLTPEVFERGITVSNAAEGIGRYLAEGTLALILASLKDITGYNHSMKEEKAWPLTVTYTESLFEKNIGLIGLGKIGRHLVRLLKPFNVRVLLYDPYVDKGVCEELGVELADLDTVLESSDIISIHAARTSETENMLNLEQLRLIKDGALLVNTARAAIINELALLCELKKGRFKAALDVFWKEPLPTDSEFRKLPNVILTPHQVAQASQLRPGQTQMVIDDIKLFLQGKTPKNIITKEFYKIMA